MATSFQKKIKNAVPSISGTKLSVHNAQLLVSSGVPSLDHLIGGGIPVGTVVLVDEDSYGTYAKIILKYFLSEGVTCGHSLFVASCDQSPEKLVLELPAVAGNGQSGVPITTGSNEDKMAIAWRYQNLKPVQSLPTNTTFGHHYDLTQTLDKEIILNADMHYWTASKDSLPNGSHLDSLIDKIQHTIGKGGFSVSEKTEKRNVLRIAIGSVGSPLWSNDAPIDKISISKFFYRLRGLLRSSYSVCMVTVPSQLFQDQSLLKHCEHMCDTCVRLESFAGSAKEKHPSFKDYHGLFHITKLSAINTITCHIPESSDLAFKLRRKRFLIEKLHLPPELQETMQREQDDIFETQSSAGGCGSIGSSNNKLDF